MGNEKAGAVKSDHGRERVERAYGEGGNQELEESIHAMQDELDAERAAVVTNRNVQRPTLNIQRSMFDPPNHVGAFLADARLDSVLNPGTHKERPYAKTVI